MFLTRCTNTGIVTLHHPPNGSISSSIGWKHHDTIWYNSLLYIYISLDPNGRVQKLGIWRQRWISLILPYMLVLDSIYASWSKSCSFSADAKERNSWCCVCVLFMFSWFGIWCSRVVISVSVQAHRSQGPQKTWRLSIHRWSLEVICVPLRSAQMSVAVGEVG